MDELICYEFIDTISKEIGVEMILLHIYSCEPYYCEKIAKYLTIIDKKNIYLFEELNFSISAVKLLSRHTCWYQLNNLMDALQFYLINHKTDFQQLERNTQIDILIKYHPEFKRRNTKFSVEDFKAFLKKLIFSGRRNIKYLSKDIMRL